MNTARILNRAAAVALASNSQNFKLPEDGYFHLARRGEFPGVVETPEGKQLNVIQVIDDEAIAQMINHFKPRAERPDFAGLLVDRDHLSSDPANSTEAEGWIEQLQVRNGDLFSKIRLSDLGRQDITGGRYRYLSGVWDVRPVANTPFTEGCRVRPFALIEAGLTNRPNISGLNAFSNRKNNLPVDPAITNPADEADIQIRKRKIMKQIAQKLGLSADASEEEILGELARLLNRATEAEGRVRPLSNEIATLKNRLEKFEDEAAEAELDRAGIRADDADRGVIKSALIANREGGLAMLRRIARPAAVRIETARQTNRATARPPESPQEETTVKNRVTARARVIRNRAQQIMNGNPKPASYKAAWNQAKSEIAAQGDK